MWCGSSRRGNGFTVGRTVGGRELFKEHVASTLFAPSSMKFPYEAHLEAQILIAVRHTQHENPAMDFCMEIVLSL